MAVLTETENLSSFFGLFQPAFGPVEDPGQLFRSGLIGPVVKEVLAGSPVVSIRGEPGVGKTSFMHVLAMELRARQLSVVVVGGGSATPADLTARIAEAGGVAEAAGDPARLLRALWHEAGIRRLILLCDHAESLPPATFRTLSLLLKLRVTQPIALQLILIGETGPWPGLAEPELDALRQATSASYTTLSLRKEEATAYLDHRLRQAGQTLGGVMTPSAAIELREQAHCNPGRLDQLAQQALLHGYRTGRRRLTARSVRQALVENGAMPARQGRHRTAVIAAAAALCLVAGLGVATWHDHAEPPKPVLATTRLPQAAASGPTLPQLHAALPAFGAAKHPPAAVTPPPPVRTAARPIVPAAQHSAVPRSEPGLVLIAGPHDTMPALYARVYRGLTPPPYAAVLAANQMPLRPGAMLIFPQPPQGWTQR